MRVVWISIPRYAPARPVRYPRRVGQRFAFHPALADPFAHRADNGTSRRASFHRPLEPGDRQRQSRVSSGTSSVPGAATRRRSSVVTRTKSRGGTPAPRHGCRGRVGPAAATAADDGKIGVLLPLVALDVVGGEAASPQLMVERHAVPSPRCRWHSASGRIRSSIPLIPRGFAGRDGRPRSRGRRRRTRPSPSSRSTYGSV